MAHPFLSTHVRLMKMFAEERKAPPVTIVHDFTRRQIEARREEQKVVVILDQIPETSRRRRAPPP